MISALNCRANLMAKPVLPDPVGPQTTISLFLGEGLTNAQSPILAM